MIQRSALLSDLQSLLKKLEADLLARSESRDVPEVGDKLRAEFAKAREAQRTAQNYEDWLSDYLTQMAAAWVLSCVFIRFLEDNRLIDPPLIAGPGERLGRARDEWELYLSAARQPSERDYLLGVFDSLAKLPGAEELFGEHNPIRELPNCLSGDAAAEILRFFQKINAETGELIHDFTDPKWDTRFLGDLYQDLSEAARKKYALLQTPEFVEEFILERTLEPAINEFGLEPALVAEPQKSLPGMNGDKERLRSTFRMIDPACGSGHFLLGSFRRILGHWQKKEPGTNVRELVRRTLASIHGVDINPYAVAIARFRLLLAAMQASGVARLRDAPAFEFNLTCGDALLHGIGAESTFAFHEMHHVYQAEDQALLQRILRPGHFHAVVANPPYITPKDRALNEAYRRRYSTCHMKYSLSVPFMQRLFQLAMSGYFPNEPSAAGYVGQITANSFMKREFGKKLIEEYLAGDDNGKGLDLTHVIDTSGAYIPGHGTPTVILLGRQRGPVASTIRTVMGIRGEPTTPDDPAQGLVWSAITSQVDQPGSQSEFVSVAESPREQFHQHPWSIGGGGAAELKEQLEGTQHVKLESLVDSIGFMAITGEDEIFVAPRQLFLRNTLPHRPFVVGDMVRDWIVQPEDEVFFPYVADAQLQSIDTGLFPAVAYFLWPARTTLRARSMFGKSVEGHGFRWYEYMQFIRERVNAKFLIPFGEVATHNHFVLDRGGKVFKQTAPVIKLPAEAREEDHLALLGLLNSSTAGFWLKQVCHQKQMMGGDGVRITSKAKVPYAFNATQVGNLPIPSAWVKGPNRERLISLAREIDSVSREYSSLTAHAAIGSDPVEAHAIRARWANQQSQRRALRARQILLQEEIDFTVYLVFGLTSDDLTTDSNDWGYALVSEGDRPFCIVDGHNDDGFAVPAESPSSLPASLRSAWDRRITAIQTNSHLKLIESSMYKRRWIGRQGLFNHQRSEDELSDAAHGWLVDRLESYFDFDGRMNALGRPTSQLDIGVVSITRLADVAQRDTAFLEVGELYRNDRAFDVQALVAELVEAESAPLLPILRYKTTGLRKRAEWEQTWELQRRQDELAVERELAKQQISRERERIASSLVKEQKAVRDAEQALREMCISVRNRYAPDVTLPDDTDADVLVRLLGHHSVNAEGGTVLGVLEKRRREYCDLRTDFDFKVSDLCNQDPGYQAAIEHLNAIPSDPEIPVPPKYISADFLKSDFWRLRGKLDVPKERWISFPHCEGNDGTPVIAWAGYDHLQLARAISAYYVDVKERLGGRDDPRLVPLLAGLLELLPWLKQWHNDLDPEFNERMGDSFEGFIGEEARQLGLTAEQIRGWVPPARATGRRRSRTAGGT